MDNKLKKTALCLLVLGSLTACNSDDSSTVSSNDYITVVQEVEETVEDLSEDTDSVVTEGNLLLNSDFESWTDGLPDGWTIIDDGISVAQSTTEFDKATESWQSVNASETHESSKTIENGFHVGSLASSLGRHFSFSLAPQGGDGSLAPPGGHMEKTIWNGLEMIESVTEIRTGESEFHIDKESTDVTKAMLIDLLPSTIISTVLMMCPCTPAFTAIKAVESVNNDMSTVGDCCCTNNPPWTRMYLYNVLYSSLTCTRPGGHLDICNTIV